MTTITIDRATVEQALEALQSNKANWPEKTNAITALRAALAEPDWQDLYLKEKKRADMWRDKYESVAGAEQRIYPLAEPVQEPVAWMRNGWGPDCGPYTEFYREDEMWRPREGWTPLYTAPQPAPDALREAAQQALEWLVDEQQAADGDCGNPACKYCESDIRPRNRLIDALRAALEGNR